MQPIDISALDQNLLNDMAGELDGAAAYKANYPNATVGNQCYHIVYYDNIGRGGIVLAGSGSSGLTSWTDADGPEDVLRRYINSEMSA